MHVERGAVPSSHMDDVIDGNTHLALHDDALRDPEWWLARATAVLNTWRRENLPDDGEREDRGASSRVGAICHVEGLYLYRFRFPGMYDDFIR